MDLILVILDIIPLILSDLIPVLLGKSFLSRRGSYSITFTGITSKSGSYSIYPKKNTKRRRRVNQNKAHERKT